MFKGWQILLASCVLLTGCVVRTYSVTKDRADQDISGGNRGYLKGEGSSLETKERKSTRTTRVVEIELHSPIRFEQLPKEESVTPLPRERREDRQISGNRGYITQSQTPEIIEQEEAVRLERYTVQKSDTLQKISKKFYGTSKKWLKIFQANKDTLKGADKIYPGQLLNIPVEAMKETKENLK